MHDCLFSTAYFSYHNGEVMNNENTAKDCLRLAFQALLQGDYVERDRLCDRARLLLKLELELHSKDDKKEKKQ